MSDSAPLDGPGSPDRNVLGAQATMVGPYLLGQTLGSGSMGKVKLGTHSETGQKVAIKILRKDMLTRNPLLRRKVEREIAVMKLMDHPNVLRLYDVLQSTRYLYLILEYAPNGEMFHYLRQEGRLDAKRAFNFFRQVINGLEYCHQRLICHRDLKPENLLLDSNLNVKIADFGMANMMREGDFLETSCGSPHYASPEVVRGDRYNGMFSDVWSSGVVLFALLFGRLPFDDKENNLQRILLKVRKAEYQFPKEVTVDPDARDLIQMMLRGDPEQRIKIAEIKRHPWWVRMNEQLTPEQRAYGRSTSDEEDELALSAVPEAEIDMEVFRTIQSLGWADAAELKAALTNHEENFEKVMYFVLLRRKGVLPSPNAIPLNQLQSVSPASPIYDGSGPDSEPKSIPVVPQPVLDDHKGSNSRPRSFSVADDEHHRSEKRERGKTLRMDSAFGLFSDKPLDEVMAELERVLKYVSVDWERTREFYIEAKARVPSKVDFDIEVLEVDPARGASGGFLVNVAAKKGDSAAIAAIFHQLQENLRLMRKQKGDATNPASPTAQSDAQMKAMTI
jgi:BR serine/threonine kinase